MQLNGASVSTLTAFLGLSRGADMQSAGECGAGALPSRPLFGGAMSALLPNHVTDISELREIPDNQEVFAHAHTDQSLIVELLEYQAEVADENAAVYHFQDIAGSNKAQEPGHCEVTNVVLLAKSDLSFSQCSSAWMLTGTQRVSKFNEGAANVVNVHLGLYRLPQFSTDVLVCFNDPQSISPASSSASSAQTHREPWTPMDFQRLLQTLTLHEPGLFG